MFLVNMAGEKAKYQKQIDSLTVYAHVDKWKFSTGYTLKLWLVKNVNVYDGYISDLDKQAYFFNYTPTARQKRLINAFCRRVAKKEGITL